jgi:hypothetical protein
MILFPVHHIHIIVVQLPLGKNPLGVYLQMITTLSAD